MKQYAGLSQRTIILLLAVILMAIVPAVYVSQRIAELGALPPTSGEVEGSKEVYEVSKLAAEIRKIRSDTSGSLFWLKMIGLFVTVGGAVGGYLVAQSQATRSRIDFEDRKNVDAVYQSMVQELSNESPILRAAATVKLGTILKSFPLEWNVREARRDQLVQLTKEVLAAALAIEEDKKVLKMLSGSLVAHQPEKAETADARGLDLSGAKAQDAYWARVDFSEADFYNAKLNRTSFRKPVLRYAQFREATLRDTVFAHANCEGANFKLADLRGADFTSAQLAEANFSEAKVYGVKLAGAQVSTNPEGTVDASLEADASELMAVSEWLARSSG